MSACVCWRTRVRSACALESGRHRSARVFRVARLSVWVGPARHAPLGSHQKPRHRRVAALGSRPSMRQWGPQARASTHAHTPTKTHAHARTHARSHKSFTYTYIHAYINIHTYLHKYSFIHTYIHTTIHTYIHDIQPYDDTTIQPYIHTTIHTYNRYTQYMHAYNTIRYNATQHTHTHPDTDTDTHYTYIRACIHI